MNKFMQIANELARENIVTGNGGPFGAVILKNGEIVGKGNNHVLESNDPTAHAEIMAIREASKNLNSYDLSGCELYTSCYPCPMCLSATIWANIKQVYYGNTKEDAESIGFRDDYIYNFIKNQTKDVLKLNQIDRDETIKVFDEFNNKSDKIIY